MSEYIITDEQLQKDHEQFYEAGQRNRRVWTARIYHGQEIVRCRDCMKWHHIDTLDGVRYGECDEWKRADSYCVPATRESGFCAWGEKDSNFTTCKCGEDIETNGRESVTCPSCGRVITE